MNNQTILSLLRHRRESLAELLALQTTTDATELVRSELHYVDAVIEYRGRHGGLDGVVLGTDSHIAPAI